MFIYSAFADKDRELGDAHAEIKALKYSERLKEKAVEEVFCLNVTPIALTTRSLFGDLSV